jgi:SAM-dependent methyltransferase
MKEINRNSINLDVKTVKGFGKEWATFTQEALADSERDVLFRQYFSLIDWNKGPKRALDFGSGSGRWDALAAGLVTELVAGDASSEALLVARKNIRNSNISFVRCSADSLPFPDNFFDLIFSLGVLHHLPDTEGAIRCLAAKLKPGGELLLYLYYAFDNRPHWFKALWRVTDLARKFISRLPFPLRRVFSEVAAVIVYWPLARTAKYLPVSETWPLKIYADRSFYVMRTDALDRFGTRLENRFTKQQITTMLQSSGFIGIRFSDSAPYWVCAAVKPYSNV